MLAMQSASAEEAMDPNAKQGGAITITYKDDVATLDPAIGYDWQNWSMIKSLFDGLMDYEPGTTTLRPELAESYDIAPDGKAFTFKLRHGVKFHNGREMTADDVKYSLENASPTRRRRALAPASSPRSRAMMRSPPAPAKTWRASSSSIPIRSSSS